jgi:hypothetical protein
LNLWKRPFREGLTKEEINGQIDLLLDQNSRERLEKSLKEIRKGKVKNVSKILRTS